MNFKWYRIFLNTPYNNVYYENINNSIHCAFCICDMIIMYLCCLYAIFDKCLEFYNMLIIHLKYCSLLEYMFSVFILLNHWTSLSRMSISLWYFYLLRVYVWLIIRLNELYVTTPNLKICKVYFLNRINNR